MAFERNLVCAVFILHRNGQKNFSAAFKVVENTIMVHPEYNSKVSGQEGIFSGHDIALAIVELSKGNQGDIPSTFPNVNGFDNGLIGR